MSQSQNESLELKVLELLDEFEDKLEASPTVPLTGKVLIDRQDFLNILKDIQMLLPDEYQHVRWIKSQKSQIVEDAQNVANELIQNARQEELRIIESAKAQENQILINADARANEMVEENEIVARAKKRAYDILSEAEGRAEDIKIGSYDYAEEVMRKIDYNLSRVLETVKENIEELEKYKR